MTSDGYPVYGANGVIGCYSEYNHAEETILVGCRGTCGEINLCAPYSYVTSNAMCLDRLSERVDRDYLICFLKAYNFERVIGGTSQPQITKAGISSIEIPLFSLEQQTAIRLRLKSILDELLSCKALLEKFDALVKSRFVEMFSDGSFPRRSLSSLSTSMQNGLSPSKAGIHRAKVMTLSAITQGGFDESAWKEGAFKDEPSPDKRISGDCCYVCRGNGNLSLVGTGEFAPSSMPDLVFPDTMIEVRVKQEEVLPAYLTIAWKQPCARDQIERFAKTTNGTYKINQKALGDVEIPVPPLALQQEFASFVAEVDKSRFIAGWIIRNLSEYNVITVQHITWVKGDSL